MLNIKNPDAHRLAREIADRTGESLTQAVIASLEERLERVRREKPRRSREELEAMIQEFASQIDKDWKDGEDPTDRLYDERGLPA
jgi:antitoxin VapB